MLSPGKLLRKKRFMLPAAALLALLVFVACLPTLIGSRWVYAPILARLAADDFQVDIQEVYVRWLWPFRFSGVDVHPPTGQPLVTVQQIRTDRGLLGFILGGRRLGRIEVDSPALAVSLLKDGSNLERFIKAIDAGSKNESSPRERPRFDVELVVRGVSAQVAESGVAVPLVVVPPFDLQLHYQAVDGDSHVTLGATQILKHVELSRDLVEIGLGHAVPLLAKSAWFAGHVSLETDGADVPLDRAHAAEGTFRLTLHEVRSGPTDPAINAALDAIARLRRVEAAHELVFVDESVVEVKLEGGRVHHRGLQFGLPKMDSRLQFATSGSVGLQDKSLDLVVEIPIPVEQLARRESVQQVGVPTLRLPITGTLDAPSVDWNALRGDTTQLLTTMREALGDDAPATAKVLSALEALSSGKADEGIGAAIDLVEQIRQNRKAAREAREAAAAAGDAPGKTPEPNQPSSQPSSHPIRDRLRDIFKK